MSDEVAVVRRLFAAVEDRDLQSMLACYADDVEIHEAEVFALWRDLAWTRRRGGSRGGIPQSVGSPAGSRRNFP